MFQARFAKLITLLQCAVIVLSSLPLAAHSAAQGLISNSELERMNVSQLESRLAVVDKRLEELAKPSMHMGQGAVGYRSEASEDPRKPVSIQIELTGERIIDQVILVPAIWRDTQAGFRADGFPLEFQVLAGTTKDSKGVTIASYTEDNQLLPRVAPLVINCPNTTASWVRLEVTKQSRWAWDGKAVLQLSEILVFSGSQNVALRQPVETSSDTGWATGPLHKQHLVDGFVPYVMDAQRGQQSIAFVSRFRQVDLPTLTLDLESVYQLDRIHLHAADSSDTVPQTVPPDFGVPKRLIVEGATSADFSDAVKLVEYHKETVYDAGPIIMRHFPAANCRYVRLTLVDQYTLTKKGIQGAQTGFAEIELFANGKNVALGKKTTTALTSGPDRQVSAITDGNNLYGQILPIKTWLGQLAQRHDLETLRPIISNELTGRYQQQRWILRWLSLLTAVLAAAAIIAVLVGKNASERAVARTREQIAADVHDELGANCHAIGLLSDLAQASSDEPEKLRPLMSRIRDLTQRTGEAASQCANMLESKGLFEDLEQDMRRSSDRLLADLHHEIGVEGRDFLKQLPSKKRVGVLLFYKESLTNVIRHSGATSVITDLKADSKQISLSVADNGHGRLGASADRVPGSLKRRAKLLGAQVTVQKADEGGTKIELTVPTKQSGFLNYFARKNV